VRCQPNGGPTKRGLPSHRPGVTPRPGRGSASVPCLRHGDLDGGVNLDLSGCDLSQGCFSCNPGLGQSVAGGTAGVEGANFCPGADLGRRPLGLQERAPAAWGGFFRLTAAAGLISVRAMMASLLACVAWSRRWLLLHKSGLVESGFQAPAHRPAPTDLGGADFSGAGPQLCRISRAPQLCCSSAAWSLPLWRRSQAGEPNLGAGRTCGLRPIVIASSAAAKL